MSDPLVQKVAVALPGREYDIHIGPGLLGQAASFLTPLLRRRRVAVITDSHVAA